MNPARIIIDPAHDFGKNAWPSLEITRRLGEMTATGWPVLLAASRKDFVGETLGADVDDRLAGTLAVTALGALLGARIFRAHDVRQTRQASGPADAIGLAAVAFAVARQRPWWLKRLVLGGRSTPGRLE